MMKKNPNFHIRKNAPLKLPQNSKPNALPEVKNNLNKPQNSNEKSDKDKFPKRTESEPGSDLPIKPIRRSNDKIDPNKLNSPKNLVDPTRISTHFTTKLII